MANMMAAAPNITERRSHCGSSVVDACACTLLRNPSLLFWKRHILGVSWATNGMWRDFETSEAKLIVNISKLIILQHKILATAAATGCRRGKGQPNCRCTRLVTASLSLLAMRQDAQIGTTLQIKTLMGCRIFVQVRR